MGLDGGGGGGGILGVSGSFTGPAEALEIVGEHAYAYSGLKSESTTAEDHINFTSGNYYFVGRLYLNGAATAGATSGGDTTVEVKFNGVGVALIRVRSGADDQPSTEFNDLIIPPYTDVACNVKSSSTDADTSSLVLVGRIYR